MMFVAAITLHAGRGVIGQWRRRVSIGEVLAAARRQAGPTITQVAERTRIRETIIRGIEEERLRRLRRRLLCPRAHPRHRSCRGHGRRAAGPPVRLQPPHAIGQHRCRRARGLPGRYQRLNPAKAPSRRPWRYSVHRRLRAIPGERDRSSVMRGHDPTESPRLRTAHKADPAPTQVGHAGPERPVSVTGLAVCGQLSGLAVGGGCAGWFRSAVSGAPPPAASGPVRVGRERPRAARLSGPAGVTSVGAAASPLQAGVRRPGPCSGRWRDGAGLAGSLRGGRSWVPCPGGGGHRIRGLAGLAGW